MNYFIQGDITHCSAFKNRFAELGFKTNGCEFADYDCLYFTTNGQVCSISASGPIANIIKTHPDYKELELPVKPNLKVGDWIVQNDNGTVSQITKTINGKDKYGEYSAYEHTNGYFAACFENEYHLWTIADAKDGDILSAKIDGDDYILIFKQIKDGWIETYCHYYITIDKFCAPTQMFCRNYQGRLYPATQEQYRTLFKKMHDDGYEWDFDKKELKKIPVKPKFKARDWVVRKDGKPFCGGNYAEQITLIGTDEKGKHMFLSSSTWVNDDDIRLWTIADSKDGDILITENGNPFIFCGNKVYDGSHDIIAYGGLNTTGEFYESYREDCWTYNISLKPATKEQRDLLFAKMKEAGYEWDVDKKELRKIKSHYNIANFKPRQWVLVRDCDNQVWGLSMFSHRDMGCYICLNREDFTQCIPFEGNERLLGTTDMPSEEYINW